MNENPSVGLFLSRNKAVAVWVSAGSEPAVLHTMNITPAEDELSTIAVQAARAAARAGFDFAEVFIAIDCGYYTQYKLRSEFNDYNQVESTIKFDAEEAAATDAMNLAVAFDITGKDQIGSEVTVYTADRQSLTDILLDVQEGTLDPSLIEPDGVCLARALSHDPRLAGHSDTVFVVLSSSNCYMIRPQTDFAPTVRTFLIGAGQNVTNILSRELMLAAGSTDPEKPIKSVVMMGCVDAIDTGLLAQRSGLEVVIEQPDKEIARTAAIEEGIACHELMIAYGAALAAKTRGHKTDFRRDFMPYQGRRKILEGSLRLIREIAKLQGKLLSEHKVVTYGKSPPRGMSVVSSLSRELARAKQMEAGMGPGDDKSVPAKLTFFLDAVNKTPKNVDVNIRQVTVTERSMKVVGDTNSRSATETLFNQVKKHPRITMNGETMRSSADNRDAFQFNVEPKKTGGTRR
ncbi:MAG: hypothetical protein ACYTCV_08215 [Planctomycetota bacterium]